jgi:hypothetical protein
MISANRDILTVSLLICIPFIPSSCLIALARNSSTVLNRSRDSGHPYLVPDFRGNGFSFSPLSIILAIGLSYIAFIMLRANGLALFLFCLLLDMPFPYEVCFQFWIMFCKYLCD